MDEIDVDALIEKIGRVCQECKGRVRSNVSGHV